MKLLILLTAACISASANGFSQTVTLSLTNAPLEKAFKEIKKQTSYSFVYIREQLKNSLPVTFQVKDAQLKEVLDICFRDQRLSFVIEDHYVIVQTKETVVETPSPNLLLHIRGRILNENSEPVEGASVQIKGTTKGTTTDHEGYFELTGVDENAILVVTGVNIESTELKVEGRSTLLLNVRTKITAQKEVIINAGYYNTTSRLSTGNISRVDAETIAKQPVSNPLEALEGRMPGVYVQQTSGVSGSGFNIEIRGLNSLRKFTAQNNGNLPLYVVDGTPFTSSSLDQNTSIANQIAPLVSPLNFINPADIESIEVLKDADATAIYGSRGANGVVLITTKKGKSGKTKVDFTVYTGVGKITHTMNLLNTEQYLQMRHEAFQNDNAIPQSFNYDVNGTWDTTRFTDWQKMMMGETAHITSVQGSISGGNQNTQFLLGGGYFRETTVFPGDFADQKGSAHFSLNHTSENKKFTATLLASYLVDHNNLPQLDPTNRALFLAPDAPPIYNADGSLNWANNTWINPFSSFLQPYKGQTNNLIANTVLSYQLLPGLNIKTSLGYNNIQMQQINFIPIRSLNPARRNPTGSSNYSDHSIDSWIVEPQVEYQKNFVKGKLSVLVGSTFQQSINQTQSFFATGFTSDALIENPSAAASVFPGFFDYTDYKYNALFARVNYKWADRYLVNLTGRRDGSSRFGPGKQFANFGAVGLGWIFSSESFIQQRLPLLSYGKIRASYGITGSDQIGDYGFLDTYTATSYPYNGTSGLTVNQLFNPDYAWETNKKFEGAIELGFLKDRFLFTTSYYQNQSSNQLVGYPLPAITGQSSLPFYNFPATVQNTGWEFELTSVNLNNKDFKWSTSVNLTIPRNKLISYPDIEKSSYANTYEVGQSLYVRKAYHFLNVASQNGIYQFQDVDKDGQISSPNDLQALNEIARDFYGGIDNNFSYKNFEIGIFFQFVKQTGFNYLYAFQPPGTSNNQPTVVLDRWQNPGDAADVQRFSQAYGADPVNAYFNATSSDKIMTDASFIRLKNLSVSYELSAKLISKLKIKKFRIYIQGQNLFTISNYLGLDPETQSFQNIPPLKILTGGIQITL